MELSGTTFHNFFLLIIDLPKQPVDLVIDTLVGNARQDVVEQMHPAAQWANQNRAPVLVVDPCAHSASTGKTCMRNTPCANHSEDSSNWPVLIVVQV